MVFEKPTDTKTITLELIKRLNEDIRRIRMLEQRIERMSNRIGGIEENILTQMNDLKLSLERINQKISDVSRNFVNVNNEILRMNKEVAKSATKRELKEIETFIDLINPLTSKFVTRDELERRIDELVKKS